MSFRLHRLSSEPEAFDPIDVHPGVNLILGERSKDDPSTLGRKVNGVGKSLCVDFIHFALLRKLADTRLIKIPDGVLPTELVVVLEATVGDERVAIRRTIHEPNRPVITTTMGTITYESLDEATDFLGHLLFQHDKHGGQVSFRQIMSLLMRDESSGFSDILNPFGGKAELGVGPHLYLLGVDLTSYRSLQKTISELSEQQRRLTKLQGTLEDGKTKKIADIPALLNKERKESEKIDAALGQLKADPAFQAVEEDLVAIERQLATLRGERKSLAYQIDQIRSIPRAERIEEMDMEILYDRVKEGLGQLVSKSLKEVQLFKDKLEAFQKSLRDKELQRLIEERKSLTRRVSELSERHSNLVVQIDRKGALSELKSGLEVAVKRTDSYRRLESQYHEYEGLLNEVKGLKAERIRELETVRKELTETHRDVELSMNRTLSAFHDRIMGNSEASFRFQISETKTTNNPVSFDCRIFDDGSYSINRDRTLLYDLSLLFDPIAGNNHPGFLLHDNILEVDQDTVYQTLNFLAEQMDAGEDFQYVLTLNRDKIAEAEGLGEIKLDIEAAKVASFTKERQFLRQRYSEK
jgi:uncharacterized protein YydD (DUF2326 family)